MLYDADLAQRMAARLLDEGIYVIGYSYPVVPQGQARIRVQISAAHGAAQLEHAVAAFAKVASELALPPAVPLFRMRGRHLQWTPSKPLMQPCRSCRSRGRRALKPCVRYSRVERRGAK